MAPDQMCSPSLTLLLDRSVQICEQFELWEGGPNDLMDAWDRHYQNVESDAVSAYGKRVKSATGWTGKRIFEEVGVRIDNVTSGSIVRWKWDKFVRKFTALCGPPPSDIERISLLHLMKSVRCMAAAWQPVSFELNLQVFEWTALLGTNMDWWSAVEDKVYPKLVDLRDEMYEIVRSRIELHNLEWTRKPGEDVGRPEIDELISLVFEWAPVRHALLEQQRMDDSMGEEVA